MQQKVPDQGTSFTKLENLNSIAQLMPQPFILDPETVCFIRAFPKHIAGTETRNRCFLTCLSRAYGSGHKLRYNQPEISLSWRTIGSDKDEILIKLVNLETHAQQHVSS